MSDLSGADRPASRALRLDTLNRLRWLAVAGQGATILAVHYWLGFELPVGFCLALVALSAWLNIALRVRYAASHRLSVDASAVLLGYDILQLAALLYLTGGLINPFALLFIVPVVVSASATATEGHDVAVAVQRAVEANDMVARAFVHVDTDAAER